jgi:hypothetical protein
MSSCAWSLLDGKVQRILHSRVLTLVWHHFQQQIRRLLCLILIFSAAGLALPYLPEEVLLFAE